MKTYSSGYHVAISNRAQGSVDLGRDRLTNETHRTIAKDEESTTRVKTVEATNAVQRILAVGPWVGIDGDRNRLGVKGSKDIVIGAKYAIRAGILGGDCQYRTATRDIVKSCVLNFSGGVLQYSVNERFSFE